jgi:hypothetical protein
MIEFSSMKHLTISGKENPFIAVQALMKISLVEQLSTRGKEPAFFREQPFIKDSFIVKLAIGIVLLTPTAISSISELALILHSPIRVVLLTIGDQSLRELSLIQDTSVFSVKSTLATHGASPKLSFIPKRSIF